MRLAPHFSAIVISALGATASTLTPPVLPLIVRNPYLSTWLPSARDVPWGHWPSFYTGQEIGFGILAAVPASRVVYPLLGRPHDSLIPSGHDYNVSYATYKGAKYDASTTNLTYLIPAPSNNASLEALELVLSFLSPITPQSTLRQAIPAAYVSAYVTGAFDIDIYIDLNGLWVSGDRGSSIEWTYAQAESDGLKTWSFKRQSEEVFVEKQDRAEWGTLYFTAPADAQHECGTSALLRQRFSKTGALQNQVDPKFRSIMDEEPVFAYSKSFALSKSAHGSGTFSDSVTFTIAHLQDPVVQYASERGLTLMRPLWKSWFFSDAALIRYHYLDFGNALNLARNYSDQLAIDAFQSGSSNYEDIVALSARQVLGATSFSGTPDNPVLFLKEISSNGNCQTVDVIFPAFPFFLYTNPRWLAYLLEPLLEHQLSGQYPNKYSMHDLGAHFPNQTGHADGRDEYMPVEECGDMLIMGLALVNSLKYGLGYEPQSRWSALGTEEYDDGNRESAFPLTIFSWQDGVAGLDDRWGGSTKGIKQAEKWLRKSYRIWKQWTGYLVEYTLEPHNQLSTDDFAGWLALHSNLALKGIIGIKAMSELAEVVGEYEDAKYYMNVSSTYIKKWEEFAISRDGTHAKLAYNWYGSWTTLYSLFADAVLCFHPSITKKQSSLAESDPAIWQDQQPLQPGAVPSDRRPDDFIPHAVYTNQSAWYHIVMQRYGLPLDSRHLYTKSDWEFEAAAVAEESVRAEILDRVANWINDTTTDRPLTDLYDTEGDGGFPGVYFFARPVVGGHFSFLALERACGGKGQ
ncbi:glutaminase A [Trichodelitschia bisporula]|uniref:Glutaminase A n=1 Tax=Trichodelitschia bisporula TaxID=703511 RepID=A0A6G1HWT2_9PEZI|nr:glutaminase A [Trichodelitschia bisporula]